GALRQGGLRHRAARRRREVLLRRRQHQHAEVLRSLLQVLLLPARQRDAEPPGADAQAGHRGARGPHGGRRPRDRHGGGHPDRQEGLRQGRPARGHPRRAPRHRRHAAPRPPRRQEPVDRAHGHRPADRLRGSAANRHRQPHLRRRRLRRPGPRVRPPVLPAEQGRQGGGPHQAVGAVRRRGALRERPRHRARAAAAALREPGCQGGAGRLRQQAQARVPGLLMATVEAASRAEVTFPPARLFIGGEWVEPEAGRTLAVENPATEEILCEVAAAGEADVDRAVAAARAALAGDWGWKTPARERGTLLWRIADALEARIDEFAHLETLDNGKPIFESRYVDVPAGIEALRYFAGWADKITGETLPVSGPIELAYTLREPVGVVAAITPWNFPLIQALWKIAPALACGNAVVHKPASYTPLSALKFAELAQECGLPPGVLNVVTGSGAEVGNALVAH